MRACVQRVSEAQVAVGPEVVGRIGQGAVVLLGVAEGDTDRDAQTLAAKIGQLRIFEDDDGRMNRSVLDVGGALLIVSQFTLMGDCRKGRRPSFVAAAEPRLAEELYERFVQCCAGLAVETQTGRFGQFMQLRLVNEGPVTLLLDSRRLF